MGVGSSRPALTELPSLHRLGRAFTGDGVAEAEPMRSLGSRVMVTGFTVLAFAVSAGISFSGYGLLSLLGVLVGVTLIAVGIRVVDNATAFGSTTFSGAGLMAVQLRRRLAIVGLIVASSAITAATGETSPALCFSLFAMLLVGLFLITVGVLGA